jgi:hypothetical protein
MVLEDEDGYGRCLLPIEPLQEGIQAFCARNGISGVRITKTAGWPEGDITSLQKLESDAIRSVEVYFDDVSNVSELKRFTSAQKIGLQTKDAKGFRSSDFPHLEYLAYSWTKSGVLDAFSSELVTLKIDKYPFESFDVLPEAQSLTEFLVGARKLTSLEGIDKFPNVRRLTVLDATRLTDFSKLANLGDLEALVIHGARALSSLAVVSSLTKLRELVLHSCADIDSVEPITNLVALERLELTGNTKISDGDLNPLMKLPKLKRLQLVPRRHYSPETRVVLDFVNPT